ncbi:aspartyl protease family protein [Cytophagaceae bacterium DM2B3-1]|uniref:Aspartyl protease family protein n=1 Tax=Xanthocytophaga flava TaxID=3048013 RepID=A0ABT7CRZ0_9BACT|nr:aspartyl protease family protein [Xanthocytophaga flavus]MDJ1466208.1 aspartyl protease family protein [Xanthocytophaga flavus]MDJ1495414.1 aspartyl protease family protein [Xanthocytophaga flavus]
MSALRASLMWRSFCIFSFVMAVAVECAQAQDVGFFFAEKRKCIVIPFKWHSNLIVIPVRINTSDTLNFILDTGISMNLLTDPEVAKKLNLRFVRKVNVTGAGQGSSLEAYVAINNQIYLPGIKAIGQNVVALSDDLLQLSSYVGIPIHGIFGFELFRHFVVKIDFRSRTLRLYQPEKYNYRGRGERIPIVIEDTKPYVYASAIYADNREIPIKVILDTGAGHALSLDLGTSEHIQLPDKIIRAQLGRGLNGIINGSLGRLEKVKIGNYELEQVITSFPDTNSLAMEMAKHLNRQGNIGCEFLKRFDVVFNYPQNYIILKPNKKSFKERFERDMSGLDVRATGSSFQKFVLEYIHPDSPADKAGLKKGDEIISLNSHMASDLHLSDVLKILQRGEGKWVKLFVRRENNFIYAEFRLKRMI